MNRFSNSVIRKFFKELSWTSLTIFIFFLITMVMRWASSRFEKESLFSSIQFGFNEKAEVFETERQVLFGNFDHEWTFFIADMLFMLSLCSLVYIIFTKLKATRKKKYVSYNFFKYSFIIIGCLSVAFDFYENFQYLLGSKNFLPYWSGVTLLKSSTFTIFLVLTILYTYLHFFDSHHSSFVDSNATKTLTWHPRDMMSMLRGSAVSILILIVIGMGLTLLDQGATLVVHLLEQANTVQGAIQIGMTIVLINLLAIIISHYPEYLQNLLEPSKKIRWHINWVMNFFPGLITFTSIHHDDAKYIDKVEKRDANDYSPKAKYANYLSLFRYYLGVMTYVAWFYVMYKAFDLYSLTNFHAWSSVSLWSFIVCVAIYYLYRAHSRDARDIIREIRRIKKLDPAVEQTITFSKKAIDKVRPWVNAYVIFLVLTFIIALVVMFIFVEFRWHKYSFVGTILYLLSNTLLYVFFRFTRLYIKFVWFSGDYIKYLMAKDHELAFAGDSKITISIENDKSTNILKKLFGKASSNYFFLHYMRVVASVSSLYLVWSFFTMGSSITMFSAIPLTLSFLMIIYIIIIYPIKFYIAYGSRQFDEHGEENQDEYYERKRKYLWIVALVCIGVFIITTLGGIDNLHKLYYVKSNDYETVEQFSDDLDHYITKEMIKNDTITPMLKITSFGGGLKSNLWTLLTMSALDDGVREHMHKIGRKDRILDYTISLSGVSGGAVGLGNYLVLDYMNRKQGPEHYNRDEVVQTIGRENVLAIDVSGIFGHDRIKSTTTFSSSREKPNKDRSYFAMLRYMKILTKQDSGPLLDRLQSTSIAEYWKEMKSGIDHNPALIINTASTGFQPGVVFSLDSDVVLFPGYIELSDIEEEKGVTKHKGLRYYDAVSTSNRFPVMSPAGQIENEGFFLDGGYFDNSGLLTTEHFFDDLKYRSDLIDKYPTGTVVILNGKSDYIRRFIDLMDIKQTEINESTNTAAIIAGITDIDKLPNVLLSTESTYSDTGDLLFKIYMPHPITIDDLYASLGGEFVIKQEIFDALEENNRKVRQALLDADIDINMEGVVVPPLARTLSQPAVDYETAMIQHHPDVKSQIKDVVDYIKDGVYIGGADDIVVEQEAPIDNGNNSMPTSVNVVQEYQAISEEYSSIPASTNVTVEVDTINTQVDFDEIAEKIINALPDKKIIKSQKEKVDANKILKKYKKKATEKDNG